MAAQQPTRATPGQFCSASAAPAEPSSAMEITLFQPEVLDTFTNDEKLGRRYVQDMLNNMKLLEAAPQTTRTTARETKQLQIAVRNIEHHMEGRKPWDIIRGAIRDEFVEVQDEYRHLAELNQRGLCELSQEMQARAEETKILHDEAQRQQIGRAHV